MEGMLNNGHSLAITKKSEIKGAVNEIDIFLKTIEHFQNLSQESKDVGLVSAPEEVKKGLFSKIFKQ